MPTRARRSAQARPAGPAPTTATRLPVGVTRDRSGRQPSASAASTMYFSTAPIVTAPKPSLSVHAPSHRRSCGQTRPQTSGSGLVSWHSVRGFVDAAFARELEPVAGCSCAAGSPRRNTDCRNRGSVRTAAWRPRRRELAVELVPVAGACAARSAPARGMRRGRVEEFEGGLRCSCRAPQVVGQRLQARRLRLHQPELAEEIAELVEDAPRPDAAGQARVRLQQVGQVLSGGARSPRG